VWIGDHELVCGDVRDAELLARLLPGVEVVSHQAAAQHLRRDEGRPGALGRAWARQTGGSVWSLRYQQCVRPADAARHALRGVASIFRSALERGEPPRVMEDGRQRRDFVHVGDVAAANARAVVAEPPDVGVNAVNVCSGEPHTIGELVAALAAAVGGPPPVVVGGARPGDVRHIVADPARATKVLGLRAATTFGGASRGPRMTRCATPQAGQTSRIGKTRSRQCRR
jgi:NAD dependent epimerase/dehydratase family